MPLRIRSKTIPTATLLITLAAPPSRGWAQTREQDFAALGPTSGFVPPPGGRTVTGRYAAVDDGRLGVRAESGTTDTLRLTELQALSVRGRQTKTGAIVGGSLGLAFGLFVGYMVGALCESADCDRGEPFLVTIPLFAGSGSLIGAAIGAAFPKWKKVYP